MVLNELLWQIYGSCILFVQNQALLLHLLLWERKFLPEPSLQVESDIKLSKEKLIGFQCFLPVLLCGPRKCKVRESEPLAGYQDYLENSAIVKAVAAGKICYWNQLWTSPFSLAHGGWGEFLSWPTWILSQLPWSVELYLKKIEGEKPLLQIIIAENNHQQILPNEYFNYEPKSCAGGGGKGLKDNLVRTHCNRIYLLLWNLVIVPGAQV